MQHTELFEIIGFDFGHGETALARTTSAAEGVEPEMLEIFGRKNHITALAVAKREQRTLIGEQAVNAADVEELHIGFKPTRQRLASPEYQDLIRRFIRTYLNLLHESKQLQNHIPPLFVVGAPSGWGSQERDVYVRLLQDSGMQRVTVEKESRAAFLHIKESKAFDIRADHLMKRVLIIDIGSSTTDFTLVTHLEAQALEDFGQDVGAGLIDQAIFDRTLERLASVQPEERQRLETIFAENAHIQRRCLILCRKGKEEYFSNAGLYRSEDERVACSLKLRTVRPPIEFEPYIYHEEMEQVLNRPLEELARRSWKQAFFAALQEAKHKMGTRQPDLVILTGGASRMGFVHTLCQEVFCDAEEIVRGTEPEFTIAKGLARIGRIDFLANELKTTIHALGNSDELRHLLDKEIPALIEGLAEPFADELLTFAIRPTLLAWREGEINTLNDLLPEIEQRKHTHLSQIRSESAQQTLDEWFKHHVLPELTDITDPICRRFDIPRSALDLRNKEIAHGVSSLDHTAIDLNRILRGTEITGLISVIAGIVVGLLSGGAGIALLELPLVGQIVAGVIGAILAAGGASAAKEEAKKRELPILLRKRVLSDAKLQKILAQEKISLLQTIKDQMAHNSAWTGNLKKDILQELQRVLNEQVEKAVMWIK
ncbi:hypothetical protein U27_05516 [Candidatus Vecturithrix granuli]|uniref:Molecular chaperone-like protein n=1 Tax=Vecturithrix granuli TaxID=1499967 RepID=A0A081C1T7_VECG1|nr:hypothetical protein U27_05516 [Candidatus Vecturithrix granuli]